jgi:hypothetical protein
MSKFKCGQYTIKLIEIEKETATSNYWKFMVYDGDGDKFFSGEKLCISKELTHEEIVKEILHLMVTCPKSFRKRYFHRSPPKNSKLIELLEGKGKHNNPVFNVKRMESDAIYAA